MMRRQIRSISAHALLASAGWLLCLFCLAGCGSSGDDPEGLPESFHLRTAATTGLTFTNSPPMDDTLNVFSYMYFYNGGGLASGDFDNDGLPDLYFTANRGPNALYLNEGNLKFREVTESAGVSGGTGWSTGAAVVDINQDGWLDIYVMQVSEYAGLQGHNELYVNQGLNSDGLPYFREAAAEFGLDQRGFGTHAVFFDYDGDGDLDCFQLNHSVHQNGTFGPRAQYDPARPHQLAGDRMLRNDDGRFTDVTAEAGIISTALGYGLGVAVGDVNNDGLPDLYVGNDFHENDYLYLNQGNGTFRETLTSVMDHTSRFTMGVDVKDLDNDGFAEIFALDMLPEDPVILKQSLAEDGFSVFRFKLGYGYNPQFSRNTLQYNRGDGTFSEIAALAGVHATDWSWAPLFFDMDDDGLSDLFISNGIPRRMNDIDWINFKTQDNQVLAGGGSGKPGDELEYVEKMPQIKLRNKFYHNTGDLSFTDWSDRVGGAETSYSNAAVYVDLDGDGDLDVVTNNIEGSPFVYENVAHQPGGYLNLRLQGPENNVNAIGASVIVYADSSRQRYEHYPGRGFQSSALGPLHLGLGDTTTIDSILVVWPDGTYQVVAPAGFNALRDVGYRTGLPSYDYSRLGRRPEALIMRDIAAERGIDVTHRENDFVDFNREPLIPHMVSAEGPALAVGDVNRDGRADFFIGSSKWEISRLYLQQADGTFRQGDDAVWRPDSVFEDVDAAFVDLEGDGDLDLVVAAGGNEFEKEQEPRKQRSYLNDGKGNFVRQDVLEGIYATASRVLASDLNGDGKPDLLLTGRVVPNHYGTVPRSYLLINQGNLTFTDETATLAPDLAEAGLVTDAALADLDDDGDPDLVLALEWGPVRILRNEDGRFVGEDATDKHGWWTSLAIEDVDADGDLDILAGNFGTNNKFRPTEAQPIRLRLNDFDGNGKRESILTYYVRGREIPFASYAELMKQLPKLKKEFIYARDFARATPAELFGRDAWDGAEELHIETMEHSLLEQQDDGSFVARPLPARLQWSSVHAIEPLRDGSRSVLLGGNFLNANIEMGWYDAGRLSVIDFGTAGSAAVRTIGGLPPGQVRRIRRIGLADGTAAFLVAYNNGPLRLLGR